MTLELQILLAVVLDLFIGDPRWFPHPVKWIGRLAAGLERPARDLIANPKTAGMAVVVTVVAVSAAVTGGLVWGCGRVSPWLGDAVSILIIYTGIAARDMVGHSTDVHAAITGASLDVARNRVAMICGRDSDRLDEEGVIKATIESVAENMVDGVTAPLFFAVLGGPVGVVVYKAINTLDSTFGYKNERYREFGWASARLDDAANFVPSRLTAILVPVAAWCLRLRAAESFRMWLRDRSKHPSPNAGQTEAAFAGALGVQLGGLSYYGGQPSHKPVLGDPLVVPKPDHILKANALLMLTAALTLALLLWSSC